MSYQRASDNTFITMLDIISAVQSSSLTLSDLILKSKLRSIKTKAKLELLYLECRRNLALLDTVDWGAATKNDSGLRRFASHIQTEILQMIFLDGLDGDNGALKKLQDIPLVDEESVTAKPKPPKPVKATSAAIFLFQRINIVKHLAHLEAPTSGMRNIHFKRVLGNSA